MANLYYKEIYVLRLLHKLPITSPKYKYQVCQTSRNVISYTRVFTVAHLILCYRVYSLFVSTFWHNVYSQLNQRHCLTEHRPEFGWKEFYEKSRKHTEVMNITLIAKQEIILKRYCANLTRTNTAYSQINEKVLLATCEVKTAK